MTNPSVMLVISSDIKNNLVPIIKKYFTMISDEFVIDIKS